MSPAQPAGGRSRQPGPPRGPRRPVKAPALARPRVTQAELAADVAAAMTEAELEGHIAATVKALHDNFRVDILRYHTFDSRRSTSGWPDDVIAGPHGVLFRELKVQGKNPTPSQRHWAALLLACGLDVAVWRPEDWVSGRIAREIARVAFGPRVPGDLPGNLGGPIWEPGSVGGDS